MPGHRTLPPAIEMWALYQECGNVHTVGELLGIKGQSVHRTLTAAGYQMNNPNLTEAQVALICDLYANRLDLTLEAIGREAGCSKASVARTAREAGIKRGRNITEAGRMAISTQLKTRLATQGHPMQGRHVEHSPATRQRIGAGGKAAWERDKATGTGRMAPEARQQLSDRMMARQADPNNNLRQGYSRARGGRRADLNNLYVRSAWEANIARYLNWLKAQGNIYAWEYEPDTFVFEKITRGTRSYTPDFKIWDTADSTPYYWEVKGWMDQQSRTRLDRMARYYPTIRLVLVDEAQYKAIKRDVQAFIPEWE